MTNMLNSAVKCHEAGLSVLPVNSNKEPLGKWKPRQSSIAPIETIQSEFRNNNCNIAVIAGSVSGDLEILDFDSHGECFQRFHQMVDEACPDLMDRIVTEMSPSCGYHVLYRCPETTIPGNSDLAKGRRVVNRIDLKEGKKGGLYGEYKGKWLEAKMENGQWYIYPELIESRGEGGYCVINPSRNYFPIQGSVTNIPIISPEERNLLITIAQSFHEDVPIKKINTGLIRGEDTSDMPGTEYNDNADPWPLLEQHGWKKTGRIGTVNGETTEHLIRPGKDNGLSASLIGGKTLYVFSTNAHPFESEQGYSPFAIYTLLEHGGNFQDAAKALAREGYGEKINRVDDLSEVEPLDIFGEPLLTGIPDFTNNFCPDLIFDYAADTAARIGVTPEVVAIPAIVVCAAASHDSFMIQPKQFDTEWRESARLWAALVGNVGHKKSAPLMAAVKPLREVNAKLVEDYYFQKENYDDQFKEYSRDKTGSVKKPDRPPRKRKLTEDNTVESLADILLDSPEGILCFRDELAGWIGSFDAYKASKSLSHDKAAWLEAFNGGKRVIDRVKKGTVLIPNWSVNVLGGIQTEIIREYGGKMTNDGLLQRFIPFHAKVTGDGEDRKPNMAAIDGYRNVVKRLCKTDAGSGFTVIKFSEDGQQYRKGITSLSSSIMQLPDVTPAMKGHLAKWAGIFARIALTFHLIEQAQIGQFPEKIIPTETAKKTADFMADFLLPNATRFYLKTLGEQGHMEHTRWIAGHILSTGAEKITRRDVYRIYRPLQNDAEGIWKTMLGLEVAGWATPTKEDRDRYPSTWKINSRVHEKFKLRALEERSRRNGEKDKIKNVVARINASKEVMA